MYLTAPTQDNRMRDIRWDSPNMLIDEKTDPHAEIGYYNLTLEDSCGNSSFFRQDKFHRTMLLEISLNAVNQTVLNWNKYFGFDFDYYHIYSGEDPDNLILTNSVQNLKIVENYRWTDRNTETGKVFYYQLGINTPEAVYYEIPDGKKAGRGPYKNSFSNLEDNKMKASVYEFLNPQLAVYPNPFDKETTLRYNLRKPCEIRIEIYSLTGQTLNILYDGHQEEGLHKLPC